MTTLSEFAGDEECSFRVDLNYIRRQRNELYLSCSQPSIAEMIRKLTPASEEWEEAVPMNWKVNPAKDLEKWPSPCVQDVRTPTLLLLGGINLSSLGEVLTGNTCPSGFLAHMNAWPSLLQCRLYNTVSKKIVARALGEAQARPQSIARYLLRFSLF